MVKLRIRVVFLGTRDMDVGWPYHFFDIDKEAERLKGELLLIQEKVKDVEFFGWDLVTTEGELARVMSGLDEADGILASPLTQEFADGNYTPNPPLIKLADVGKPLLVYTRPFSTYWDQSSRLLRRGNTVVVDSSRVEDIIPKLEVMRAVSRLKDTVILMVKDLEYPKDRVDPRMRDPRWMGVSYMRRIREIFGIEIKQVGSDELISAYEKIDVEDAKKVADELIEHSAGLKEPSKEDVVKASRMYLAAKNLLKEKNANAFTFDCLTMIRGNILPASACIAIPKLNDEGIPAACEADIESLVTICICHALADRPGYQADPVIDESDNTLTMAHCVAPTKMEGHEGGSAPYYIRNHGESRRGVCLQVEGRKEQKVTVLKLIGRINMEKVGLPEETINKSFGGYTLLAKNSKIIGNIDSERGCRTKITLPLDNPEEFKRHFHGQHRILCYGDWTEKLRALSQFLGIDFANRLCLLGG